MNGPADQLFTASGPESPYTTTKAAQYLTRETVEAAIARLMEAPMLRVDPVQVRAELALARWLDEQTPGTAEKLLQRVYGREERQRRPPAAS